jgi:Tfp pilus assembly PilM family ATPase
MAYNRKQLEALQAALSRGEHRIAFEGKVVEYRSIVELKQAIREVEISMREDLVQVGKAAPYARQIRITTDKGF